ncbi:MAG TPA: VCBS repeat-containing protein [Dokdonella sp.]|uniref:FG-GAP repeat domain-containing protein n=1 Tax=Dokdonella sp. TaxID=2291710 RepID=UPI002BAA4173|nr:VCBS repeat-containing protein [Dokdonella sp.]HUD42549.1 VCBS repeat-containing protein [Dokdonella sp.]
MTAARLLGTTALLNLMWGTTAFAVSATQPRLIEQGHRVDTISQLGAGHLAITDLDGDGVQEVVFQGYVGFSPFPSQKSVIAILKRQPDGSFGILDNETILESPTRTVRMLAWSQAGDPRIIAVDAGGIVGEYADVPLRERRTFPIVENAFSAAIGDVDADGNDDLVVVTQTGLHTYALASGQLLRSLAVSGNEAVALAQLDADPALEIILGGGTPGLILDGATHAIDWQYADGFGYHLAVGRFGADPADQWVGTQAPSSFTLFGSSPWSTLWSKTLAQSIDTVGAATLDASGRDWLLIGDASWGSLRAFDGVDQQERLQISNGGGGVGAVAGVDFDRDGLDDIVFAASYVSGFNHALAVADGQTGSLRWTFYPNETPYTSTALGDVDGDGRIELVAAARHDGGGTGAISIFDAETGQRKWRTAEGQLPPGYPLAISTSRIELVARPSMGGMDIVLAGSLYHSGKLLVVDGKTKEVRLDVSGYLGGTLQSRAIRDMALLDYDQDGTADFLLALQGNTGALTVLSGVDGSTLWTSAAMGSGGTSALIGVFFIDGTSAGADTQLVAVMSNSLRSFSASTGLLNWILPVYSDGALYVPSGVEGPEIAVFSSGGYLQFFSAATLAPLRQYSLPSPLRAMTLLDDDARSMLAASGGALRVFDGTTGLTRVTSDSLTPFPETGGRLAVHSQGDGSWQIASGTQVALYRHRLELREAIFGDGFDGL